ncbi:MAG: lipoate--protein ligase family protein [Microbacter sp.]
MINVKPYNLPDRRLLDDPFHSVLTWVPDRMYIVLGASNRPEEALRLDQVLKDGIEVLKRPSGGQTVLLSPNNVVIGLHLHAVTTLEPKQLFDRINNHLMDALKACSIDALSLKGISDLAFGDKKVMGSAIYRSHSDLLYHAVLNVSEPAATFEKYLTHPAKEPDYRHGRPHHAFVTSLHELGCQQSPSALAAILLPALQQIINVANL